jgi:hypothetical protein
VADLLTPEEKTKVRHHLGYLGVASAFTFVLGIPAAVQTQFTVEGAFNLILPESLPEVRRHLRILDRIEELDVEGLEDVEVEEIGDIKIDAKFYEKRWAQYERWRRSLANLFGIAPNPFDQRLAGHGLSVRVNH